MNSRLVQNGIGLLTTFIVAVVFVIPGAAQSNAPQVSITVTDATGGRLPGASVQLQRGNLQRTADADANGAVQFNDLETGEWTLTVIRDGFLPRQRPVVVQSIPVSVNVTLDVAGVQESVTVEAVAGPPETLRLDAAATGGTFLDIPIRDLPATLVVVTQDMMQERGTQLGHEAAEVAGGMETTTGSGSIVGYRTRGFSGNSVSVMRDGIRQNTISQSSRPIDTFTLDRVEVLKGPASLLFGEGAIGASVNYVSKEPAREFGVDTLMSYGSFGTTRAGLGLNIPIAPRLSGRFDGSYSNTTGYMKPSGSRLRALTGTLRWTPTEYLTIKPTATVTDDNIFSYYSTPLINGQVDPRMRFINYNMRDAMNKGHSNFGRIDAELQLPKGWRVRNGFFGTTQRLDWRNMEGYSYNATTQRVQVSSYFLIHRNDNLVGNQTDVRKTFDVAGHAVNFISGFTVSRNYQLRGITPPGTSITVSLDPFNPAPFYDPGLRWIHGRTVIVNTKTTFAEAQTSVTDRLKVITGLRWEKIQVDHDNKINGILDITKFDPTSGRVGAVYTVMENINVYASYSRAVEPTVQLVDYDAPDQVFQIMPSWQFETGVKATAFRGRLDGTLTQYYIQKKNIPTRTEIDGVILQQQVGKQRSLGYELNFVARPTSTTTLSGDMAITLGKYLEFNENQGTGFISRAGNVPSGNPDLIWSFTPSQRIGPVTASMLVRTVGGRWADNANTQRRPQYTIYDAWVSVRVPSESRDIRLTLRGRNLSDRNYVPGGGSNTSARLPSPRSFEAALSMGF